MGVNDRVQDEKDSRRKRAEEKKEDRIGSRRGAGVADWGGVSGELLINAVQSIAVQGGALRLGYTRDGGAFAVGVYYKDQHYTVYANAAEGVEPILEEVIEKYGK